MKTKKVILFAAFLGFIAALFFTVASEAAEKKKSGSTLVVSEGKSVKVNYTLTVDGKVVDSSNGRGPLEFKAGSHQMIPGFEKAVMGMKTGEKKSFKVSPKEGYGLEDPKAIRDIPKNQLPPEMTPKVGMTLTAKAERTEYSCQDCGSQERCGCHELQSSPCRQDP